MDIGPPLSHKQNTRSHGDVPNEPAAKRPKLIIEPQNEKENETKETATTVSKATAEVNDTNAEVKKTHLPNQTFQTCAF